MRRFSPSEQIKEKSGVEKTNGAANMPRFQALSSMVSIGTIEVKPRKQLFHVANALDNVLQRSPLSLSLGCKEIQDLVKPERALYGIRNNHHMNNRIHFGSQRGDPKGLAYDKIYPINTPLLVKSDTFFSYLKTPIK